jgi:hypothetical protein
MKATAEIRSIDTFAGCCEENLLDHVPDVVFNQEGGRSF